MLEGLEIPLCLPMGNIKVGKVYTFSLPSFVTCPGASNWCRRYCYAARIERLRPACRRAYVRNLALSLDPRRFTARLLDSLPEDAPLVRIHVGGDFYSPEYAESWIDVCRARPRITFWSYTRSWSVKNLLPILEQLRLLPNVQLWASVDADMPLPPNGWRTAFLAIDTRCSGMHCRHQQGQVDSCLACGYCFRERQGNVVFKVH